LRWYRQTLEIKCQCLDAEQLAQRPVHPSSLSLLGLLRHIADVERHWFRRVMSAEDAPPYFYTPEDLDGDFDNAIADPELVDEAWLRWREEVAYAEAFVDDAPNLEITGAEKRRGAISLRWVLVHMIQEYARHVGHADLMREAIDGAVGE
jgi:uncharacterized damage-inducible protein DinB